MFSGDFMTLENIRKKTVGLRERKCIVCGKVFDAQPGHAYKKRKKGKKESFDFYCSYSCMRKDD